ncbi:MAG: hypothetical protein Q7V63_08795 [Gammaproteobacteria bacterium]|nr:hypothetical protein [Gammaproteobacteria bacterium]
MQILKKILVSWLFLLIFTLPITSFAIQIIKIAILDNVSDPYLPSTYEASYIAGIETATLAAKNKGYTIQYKTFFYGSTPLAILDKVPEVKAWRPDLIIGPGSSNQFLLLAKSFNNTLVLSPYASDQAIANMPDNFYSLALLDKEIGHIIVKFISGEFPNNNLVNVVAADCKDCVDMTNIISSQYAHYYPAATITSNMYTGNSGDRSNQELTYNYKSGDVILVQPNTYIESEQLMYQVANYLGDNPIFISDLVNIGAPSDTTKSPNYTEYWFTPYLFDDNSPNFREFSKDYSSLYNSSTNNPIAFTVYLTIISAVNALALYPQQNSKDMRAAILDSYTMARASNPYWYKTSNYAIYKIDPEQTKLIGTISAYD